MILVLYTLIIISLNILFFYLHISQLYNYVNAKEYKDGIIKLNQYNILIHVVLNNIHHILTIIIN